MFYKNSKCAYRLVGAYHVCRKGIQGHHATGRTYSALGYRLRGGSRFLAGEKEYYAGEKSVIYIPAGVEYHRFGSDEELIILRLCCYGEEEKELTVLHADGVEELFFQLFREWQANGEHAGQNACMALLYRIFDQIEKTSQRSEVHVPPVILPAVTYLKEHYRDPDLTVAFLAELCHVSEVYFRRIYHVSFGVSPWQSVQELRFFHACTLLRSGYYGIKEVAQLCGFSDVKYFRTAFTKRYGVTPSDYRKRADQGMPKDGEHPLKL